MAEKRKDNKGRILRTGESQRNNGTYMFRYKDLDGKRKYVYDNALNSLRIKEKEIQRTIDEGMNYQDGEMTFLELFDMFIGTKHNLRPSTLTAYKSKRNTLKSSFIANIPIKNITVVDINRFIDELKSKMTISSLREYVYIYKATFNFAVKMDMIKKNPFVVEIIGNDSKDNPLRIPLTEEQTNNLLTMLYERKNKRFYYICKFILLSGLRIGEVLGLTWKDIDFKNRKLSVTHQLVEVNNEFHIGDTKTKAGHRDIYIYNELFDFLKEYQRVKYNDADILIDGYHGFIFAYDNKMITRSGITADFTTIRKQYQRKYGESVYITPHVLRHTFCTNMIKSGVNIKTVQYLMGHSNVGVTLDIYTRLNFEDTVNDLRKIMGN